MRRLLTVIILIFIVSCNSQPQTQNNSGLDTLNIADLKIEKNSTILDKNSDYWNKLSDKIYQLNEGYTEIFYSSSTMGNSSLMPQSDINGQDMVILNINSEYNKPEIIERVTKQLNDQLGQFEMVKVNPVVTEPSTRQWLFHNFRVRIPTHQLSDNIITITKQKDSPKF